MKIENIKKLFVSLGDLVAMFYTTLDIINDLKTKEKKVDVKKVDTKE